MIALQFLLPWSDAEHSGIDSFLSADTNNRWKKVFSSWNSVPLSCPLSNPGLRCLLHSAAFSTPSFSSWCSFRGVTSCCVSSEVCSHGSWWCLSGTWFIYIFAAFCFSESARLLFFTVRWILCAGIFQGDFPVHTWDVHKLLWAQMDGHPNPH